jgi:hypothetical protein
MQARVTNESRDETAETPYETDVRRREGGRHT